MEQSQKDVVVYSKPGCKNCKILKKWLDIKDVTFEEVDISVSQEGYDKLIDAGRLSLPVVEIDGVFVDITEYNDILEMIETTGG